MKAFLMHDGQDFDTHRPLPDNEADLVQDLELNTLLEAMADQDGLVLTVAKRALLLSLQAPESILYRQQVLSDCLRHPDVIRHLYELAGDALAAEKTVLRSLSRDAPGAIQSRAVQVLGLLTGHMQTLREAAAEHAAGFASPGFTRFFATITQELDDQYLAQVHRQLDQLRFRDGQLISAQLGAGNHGTEYALRPAPGKGWLRRFGLLDRTGYSFTIPDRDVNGFRALGELQDKGLNLVANALAQATDHVLSFFTMLRVELAFYVGCMNLHQRLQQRHRPCCLPQPASGDTLVLSATGLYDPCLTITTQRPVIGNDLHADDKALVMITGANQGGKSTLLRAIGLAQLMTQAGMFASAEALHVNLAAGVFTHFKREEDETMQSGKLDEELRRMSEIVDHVTPGAMLLCNESLASTNEREGSQIARQVVRALTDEGVKVLFVTHQFDLGDSLYATRSSDTLFLRAGRDGDRQRTYKITQGEPLPTSYGQDAYRAVFGRDLAGAGGG